MTSIVCATCGHDRPGDLVTRYVRVYADLWQRQTHCADPFACAARYDERHGLWSADERVRRVRERMVAVA